MSPTHQQLNRISELISDVSIDKVTSLLAPWDEGKVIIDYWLQDWLKADRLIAMLELDSSIKNCKT